LYRRAKAEAAVRGCNFNGLVLQPETPAERPAGPSLDDLMREFCGIAKDAPADYATNPKYMEG
jgi:hypothetical protein